MIKTISQVERLRDERRKAAHATTARSPCFWDLPLGTRLRSTLKYEVTAQDIHSIAEKWDPMPIHMDEAAAKKAGLRAISAPGVLVRSISIRQRRSMMIESDGELRTFGDLPITGLSKSFKTLLPVYAGDTLELAATVKHKRQSQSKPEHGVMVLGLELRNQLGELVYSEDDTVLVRVVLGKAKL